MDLVLNIGELVLAGEINEIGILGQFLGIVAVVKTRAGSSAASVFPLGLARKSIPLAFLFAQPVAKGDSVAKSDVHHGMVIGLRKSGLAPTENWSAADALA